MGGCDAVRHVVIYKRTGSNIHVHARASGGRTSYATSPTCANRCGSAPNTRYSSSTIRLDRQAQRVQHATGGYLLWDILTMRWVFDLKPDDVFWCTADVGWVTGHSYACCNPLAAGAAGKSYSRACPPIRTRAATEDDPGSQGQHLHTAPTAIRSLIKAGADLPKKYDLSSLRLLGSVGEPINPEAWMWYHTTVGGERCPIVDTWWQTETGGLDQPSARRRH